LNPSNHHWENERKLSLLRVWQTDGEPDGHRHTIRPVFNGRMKRVFAVFSLSIPILPSGGHQWYDYCSVIILCSSPWSWITLNRFSIYDALWGCVSQRYSFCQSNISHILTLDIF
jgi:hypothetical protein